MANVDNVTVRSKHCRECGICFAVNSADEIKKQVEIIVRETVSKLAGQNPKIPIGVSNRHIHISREILDRLYGNNYQLNKLRDLYQTGEFAAKETLTVIGPKMKAIENIRILGPIRNYTQVELSKTDGIYLGIALPVRESGNIKDSSPITLSGPKGTIALKEGAIRANRHLHMNNEDALYFKTKDAEIVKIKIPGDKAVMFDNVQVRIKENFKLELHLDTDDANAADVSCNTIVTLVR